MKKKIIFLFCFLIQLSTYGQNARVTIKVVNEELSSPVEGAVVEIEQLPGVIKLTDDNGIVIFNDIPIGRISIRCTANKYVAKTTHYNNVSSEIKNNYYEIGLVQISNNQEYLIYGEISSNGEDISQASVEVKVLDQIFNTKSDDSGNYSIKIPKNNINGVQYFRIEIKKKDCGIYKEKILIPASLNLLKDINIDCNNSSKSQKNKISNSESNQAKSEVVGDYEFTLHNCERNEGTVTCHFTIISKNKDRQFSYLLGATNHESGAFDDSGNTYAIKEGKIGNKAASGWGTYYKLITDVPTPARIVIRNFPQSSSKLALLELSVNGDDLGYKKIPFRNISIR